MAIKSDVDPISRTKDVHPAVPDFDFVDLALLARGGANADLAFAAMRLSRAESGLPVANRKIWCSAYHPSRVSGGCAIIGGVIP